MGEQLHLMSQEHGYEPHPHHFRVHKWVKTYLVVDIISMLSVEAGPKIYRGVKSVAHFRIRHLGFPVEQIGSLLAPAHAVCLHH